MSYVRYIVEGYRLDIVDLSDDSVVALQVPAQNLSALLSVLSKYGILHSSPYRDVYTTAYTVYIPSTYREEVQDIAKDLVADIGNLVKLDDLSNSIEIVGSMSYRGIRMDLYKSRGWSRASGGKLYNKNMSVTPPEIKQLTGGAVEVFKAVKLGYDVINDSHYLFVDARRKLEIVKSIDQLENSLGTKLGIVSWFKVIDTTTSFTVVGEDKRMSINDILSTIPRDKIEEVVNKAIEYLSNIGKISEKWTQKQYKVDDLFEYALAPKSVALRQDLISKGLMLRDPNRNIEVLFLPKEMLTPVPTLDIIKKLFFSDDSNATKYYSDFVELLKLSPGNRHSEIQDFINELSKDGNIRLGPLTISIDIDNSPFTVPGIILTNPRYVEAIDEDAIEKFKRKKLQGRYTATLSLTEISRLWSPYEKLRSIRDDLYLLIVGIGKNDVTVEVLNKLRSEICKGIKDSNQCQRVFNEAVVYEPYSTINDVLDNLGSIISEVRSSSKRFKGVLFIGPEHYLDGHDIRDLIEYRIAREGIFSRYIKLSGEVYHKFLSALGSFVTVVPKVLSHKLKPLIISIGNKKFTIDRVIGIDATIIGMERGSYRVACAISILDISKGRCMIKPDIKISDVGEDAALADILKNWVLKKPEQSTPNTITLVYVNRAKPEIMLRNYLSRKEVETILNKAIIVGATKTHSYSRVIKLEGLSGIPVNPEPSICVPLYTGKALQIQGVNVKISKYLFVPVQPPQKIASSLTVMPILLTFIIGGVFATNLNLDKELLDFTASLIALNNISRAWIHSLPWPLHEANRKLRTVQRLASTPSDVMELLRNEVFEVL
jgi:hypothetical protein